MKFLRANPNLLLKVVPTTLAVDEQGVETMNRDLKEVKIENKPSRIKSGSRKKKPIKSTLLNIISYL